MNLPADIIEKEIMRQATLQTVAAMAMTSSWTHAAATRVLTARIGAHNLALLAGQHKMSLRAMVDFWRGVVAEDRAPLAKLLMRPFADYTRQLKNINSDYFTNPFTFLCNLWLFVGLYDCVRIIPYEHGVKYDFTQRMLGISKHITRIAHIEGVNDYTDEAEIKRGINSLLAALATPSIGPDYNDIIAANRQYLVWIAIKAVKGWYPFSNSQRRQVIGRIIAAADVHLFNVLVEVCVYDDMQQHWFLQELIKGNETWPRFDPAGFNVANNPKKWWQHVVPPVDRFEAQVLKYKRDSASADSSATFVVPKWADGQFICQPVNEWHTADCDYCEVDDVSV